jgi:hypothetical protein
LPFHPGIRIRIRKELSDMINRKLGITAIMFCLALVAGRGAQAAVVQARSLSSADVQAAVNAAVDGDTVAVPAGSASWSSSVAVTGKSITIQGAGTALTRITTGGTAFAFSGMSSKPFRLTGFAFSGSPGSYGYVRVNGPTKGFRIDNCNFSATSGRCLTTYGITYGVVDHCRFTVTGSISSVTYIEGNKSTDWKTTSSLGTADALFFEDNIYERTDGGSGDKHAVWSQGGGRWVFRHNTVYNLQVDAHGSCGMIGTVSYEWYENQWYVDRGTDLVRWMFIRGGTGVVFNNRINVSSTRLQRGICLYDYRIRYAISNPCIGTYASCCYSWPCAEQIGQSPEGMSPLYLWNNTITGSSAPLYTVENWGSDCSGQDVNAYIKEGRDFYTGVARPGYTPYVYPHPLVSGAAPPPPAPGPKLVPPPEMRGVTGPTT